ncbi:hypothetical protein J5N97_022427 [Dioscorea zingiberensis]|uniref:Uncharacterized protein n=1 Tax=Dioscorea zingiberensis TaxID=325984 RepID=A0A9D5CBY0_9LILI|nr:hypothetical protein J5N97_022427 [Dioscorea zingiberensis]
MRDTLIASKDQAQELELVLRRKGKTSMKKAKKNIKNFKKFIQSVRRTVVINQDHVLLSPSQEKQERL